MQHVENMVLLISLFDVTNPLSHNRTMLRTMSSSQPSITGCGRAGPFIVFIFTQSLWHFGVSNTKINLLKGTCGFTQKSDNVCLQKVAVKSRITNK